MVMKKLCIDIGNTMSDLGIVDLKERTCLRSIKVPTTGMIEKMDETIDSLFGSDFPPLESVMCSVVSEVDRVAEAVGANKHITETTILKGDSPLPFANRYENSHVLGADRIANALYAFYTYPGKAVIVIDAGTTVTIDFVDPGKGFAGGLIMPGIRMQLRSLNAGTAALPLVEDTSAGKYPGKCTEECMRLGALYSTAGGIEKIVNELRSKHGNDLIVAACGGSWPQLSELVNFDFHYERCLTLIGLSLFRKDSFSNHE